MRIAHTPAALLLAAVACQNEPLEDALDHQLQRMVDQPRCAADESTTHFDDGACNREPPVGTRTFRAAPDAPLTTGRDARGAPLTAIPIAVDRALLATGRRRFDLFCATCHGLLGDGQSQVAENMRLRKPPSLHDPVLQALPPGQVFRVISDGYGLMPSYAGMLDPRQRWAVVAYLGALRRSQWVPLAALSGARQKEAARWLH